MKRFALILLVLVGTAGVAQAQQPWAEKLFKDGVAHDFGTVSRGSQLLHRFTITNIYAVKMQLTDIRVSCGCATVTPSSKTIEPRGTATLDVVMDTRRFNGPKSVTIFVTVGPEFVSTAELKISANIRSDVVFNPGQLAFGVVSAGQSPSETIDIEYAGTLDWKITEALANNAPVEVSFKELYRKQGQVGYQIKATLKSDAPSGTIRQPIVLKTNDPTTPTLAVLVEANIQAALSVSPGMLRLGGVKPNQEVVKKIVMQGKSPFKITNVEGLGDGIELVGPIPDKAASVHTLSFRILQSKEGDFRKQINIKTDLQEAPVTLPIEATIIP